jgi:hypothetical protein
MSDLIPQVKIVDGQIVADDPIKVPDHDEWDCDPDRCTHPIHGEKDDEDIDETE